MILALTQAQHTRLHDAGVRAVEAVLIVLGALLLARFVHWVAGRATQRVNTRLEGPLERAAAAAPTASTAVFGFGTTSDRSERVKHNRAVLQAADWGMTSLVYFVAGILVLNACGLPLTTLVAPATVAGVALGFGAQRIVLDLLSGFFIFSERQFGIGDIVRVSTPGSTTGVSGTVEEITLRVTKLRGVTGELIIVSNGELRQVTNQSKDWSQVVVDVPLPLDRDVDRALEVLQQAAAAVAADDRWKDLVIEHPRVTGVETIDVDHLQLRVLARTLPGRQWEVGRELRTRIADALRAEGLLTAAPATSFPAP